MDTVKVEGKSAKGEPRTFVFKLVNAENGLKLMHSPIFPTLAVMSKGTLAALDNSNQEGVLSHIQLIIESVGWEPIQKVFKGLLPGSIVRIGETNNAINEAGICDYAPGDIFEQYVVLSYALRANFAEYIDFLEGALAVTDLSIEETGAAETEKEALE